MHGYAAQRRRWLATRRWPAGRRRRGIAGCGVAGSGQGASAGRGRRASGGTIWIWAIWIGCGRGLVGGIWREAEAPVAVAGCSIGRSSWCIRVASSPCASLDHIRVCISTPGLSLPSVPWRVLLFAVPVACRFARPLPQPYPRVCAPTLADVGNTVHRVSQQGRGPTLHHRQRRHGNRSAWGD